MEIIELSEIIEFENKIVQLIKQNDVYSSICQVALKNRFQCQMQVIRFVQNGKYFSQLEIEILSHNCENIKEKNEPNCILMISEPLCFSRHNKLNKINLLFDNEFIEELTNLLNKLNSVV